MGTTTIDLPDPLQQATPLPAPSADELLAQLAGDEIDRLLAEADARPEPAPTVPAAAPAAPAPPPNGKLVDPTTDPELAMELDSLFNQLKSDAPATTPPVDAPVVSTAIPAADAGLRREIDALYNPIVDQPPPARLSAATMPATPPAPMSIVAPQDDGGFSAALQSLDATADPSAATTALEKQVLASEDLMKAAIEAAMPVHADAPVEAAAAVHETAAAAEPAVHRSLNPLAWLSNAFSDAMLDALGKVAILTLINALAILIYVVVFRRH